MIKKLAAAAMIAMATLTMTSAVWAAGWNKDAHGSRYDKGNGHYVCGSWQWIDNDSDGTAECYYFDKNGYMLTGTTTPDGFVVNTDGQWVINGQIQTKPSGTLLTYNSEGISDVVIDMMNSTKQECAEKYGVLSEYTTRDGSYTYIKYENQLTGMYVNNQPSYYSDRIYVITSTKMPSHILKGLKDDITDAGKAEENLKENGYTNTYNNGIAAVTTFDNYQTQWNPGHAFEIAKRTDISIWMKN